MAEHGAALQSSNVALVGALETLRSRRREVQSQIEAEEEERESVERDIATLQERLAKLNASLAQKVVSRNEYDRTLHETEVGFSKILDASTALLSLLQRESHAFEKG